MKLSQLYSTTEDKVVECLQIMRSAYPLEKVREALYSIPVTIHFDGGSRGNPGPAAYGAVVKGPRGKLAELTGYLGVTTNNVAEYQGLIASLEYAVYHRLHTVHLFSDSELVVKQVNGIYKVSHPSLIPLYQKVRGLMAQIPEVSLQHVYREKNREADSIVNRTLDSVRKKGEN